MANRQTTPGIQPVRQGLVDSQPQQLMPQISWQSPLRDVAGITERAADFTKTYQNLRFEEYQAKYDNLANQMYHEMDVATDPCQLQEIKNKYDEAFAKTLDDTIWASSYNNSRYKQEWTRNMNTNYEKVYLKKMNDFAVVQTERTLNEMVSAAAQSGDVNAAASYLAAGMNLVRNNPYMDINQKSSLQEAYAKNLPGGLFTKDPNFALSFVDKVGGSLAPYGVDINDIRNRAESYNEQKKNDEWQAYTRAKQLKSDNDTAMAKYYAARVQQGDMKAAEASSAAAQVSDEAFLEYNRLMKNSGEKQPNPNVEEFNRVYREEGEEAVLKRFKEDAVWQDDPEIRTLTGNKILFPEADNSNIDQTMVKDFRTELEKTENGTEVARLLWEYDDKNPNKDTAAELKRQAELRKATFGEDSTGANPAFVKATGEDVEKITTLDGLNRYRLSTLKERAQQNAATRTLVNEAITARENLIKSANADALAQEKNRVALEPGDLAVNRSASLNIARLDIPASEKTAAYETIGKNIAAIRKEEAARTSATEKEVAEREQAAFYNDMVSALENGAYYDDEAVSGLIKTGQLTAEQAKNYRTARDKARDTAAEYDLHFKLSRQALITPDTVAQSGASKNKQLEMLDSQAVKDHNAAYYKNNFYKAREKTLDSLNAGEVSYENALYKIRMSALENGQDAEQAVSKFEAYYNNTNNRAVISKNLDLFDTYYGWYDEKNLYEVNKRNELRAVFETEMAKRLAEGKGLDAYTEEYIRVYAQSSRPTSQRVKLDVGQSRKNLYDALGSKNTFFDGKDDVLSGKYLTWDGEYDDLIVYRSLYKSILEDKNIPESEKGLVRSMYIATEPAFKQMADEYQKNKDTNLGQALSMYRNITSPKEEELADISEGLVYNLKKRGINPLGDLQSQEQIRLAVLETLLNEIEYTGGDNVLVGDTVIPKTTIDVWMKQVEGVENGGIYRKR